MNKYRICKIQRVLTNILQSLQLSYKYIISLANMTVWQAGLGSITMINYNYNYNYTIELGFNYNYNYIIFVSKFQLQLQLRHTYKCQLQLQL